MGGLQFIATIVNSVAWPAAVVVAVILLRRELIGAFRRMQSLEFPGGKATFATLLDFQKVVAEAGTSDDRYQLTEFREVEALTSEAPGQAVIDAWGLLEYQLNVASDRVDPDHGHGWPQVARNLETWDKWPILYPAILELRRLRDYTVRSGQPPSRQDAARYVSVAQDLATTLRTSFPSRSATEGDNRG